LLLALGELLDLLEPPDEAAVLEEAVLLTRLAEDVVGRDLQRLSEPHRLLEAEAADASLDGRDDRLEGPEGLGQLDLAHAPLTSERTDALSDLPLREDDASRRSRQESFPPPRV